ncbi:hypothetical protein L1887_60798 [Cichorium endivia]|nr:hypothetical protein L1887_60798 [Cichorium endivia]
MRGAAKESDTTLWVKQDAESPSIPASGRASGWGGGTGRVRLAGARCRQLSSAGTEWAGSAAELDEAGKPKLAGSRAGGHQGTKAWMDGVVWNRRVRTRGSRIHGETAEPAKHLHPRTAQAATRQCPGDEQLIRERLTGEPEGSVDRWKPAFA